MSKGDDTKAMIIAKSAALFNTQGYAGTSMSDIMRATGLQKGGIYRHFESKDALALAAFDYEIMLINQHYLEAIRDERHAVSRLRAILHAFQVQHNGYPLPGGCPIMNTSIEADDTHPALKKRVQEAMNSWQSFLIRIIERGIARGEIQKEANAAMTATLIITTLEGALMLSRLYEDQTYLHGVINHLEQYFSDHLAI